MSKITPDLLNLISVFPHLEVLHTNTRFELHSDYLPKDDLILLTLFFTEPGRRRMRVDAEWRPVGEDLDPVPSEVRINYWGTA